MSSETVDFYQSGIKCDHAECKVSIWRMGPSRELAATIVQLEAKAAGWAVALDRIYGMHCDPNSLAAVLLSRDYCPDHRPVDVTLKARGG